MDEATTPPPQAASTTRTRTRTRRSASSSPTTSHTGPHAGEYVAVHHCSAAAAAAAATPLRNCIFLSWTDAAPHLAHGDLVNAQYKVCPTLAHAERYLHTNKHPPGRRDSDNDNNSNTRGTKRKAVVAAAVTLRTMVNRDEQEEQEEEEEEDDDDEEDDEEKYNEVLEGHSYKDSEEEEPAPNETTTGGTSSPLNNKSYRLPKQWKFMFQQLAATVVDAIMPQHFDDNSKLKAWVKRQHVEYEKLVRNEPNAHISNEQVQLLQSIGFVFRPELARKDEEWNHEFNRRMVELEAFTKANNGDCRLNPSQADRHRDLYLWTLKLKREHLKLESSANADDGESTPKCRLTPDQLQRLANVGFAFRQHPTWENRMKELVAYHQEGKNVNMIPASQTDLKKFTKRQRDEYKLWMEGRPSGMTQERVDALEQIGFDFRPKRRIASTGVLVVQKTWDERYRELLEYQKQHGDTCVPFQIPGGLGHWVAGQRINLKQFFNGEKSIMNAERVARLTAIGFIVDVHDYRRSQKLAKTNNAGGVM